MINTKFSKTKINEPPLSTEDRLFKLLESIDWKLWEMYNMQKLMFENVDEPKSSTSKTKKTVSNKEYDE